MGGKHLKKQRAEKAKVHLKKKTLPKGQNITDTTFKVKKIVTVEQLKKVDENEPVSNWNVPLKDLLVRLNHYNYTTRLNGLTGIKELLSKYPEILKGPSLKSLICRLLELMTDEEHKVRNTAVNLLSFLFELIPSTSLVPFYDILNVYLGCAMTHRTKSVQEDSLMLIDIMLKYSPDVIKSNFFSIAQQFLRIFKSYLNESHAGGFSSTGAKQNLEEKKTKILLRFYQFLDVGYGDTLEKKSSRFRTVNISAGEKVYLKSLSNEYKRIPDLSLVRKTSEAKDKICSEFDSQNFQSLCSHILPLVFDTWKEFSPPPSVHECPLSRTTGELLLVLLKILLLLYEKAVASGDKHLKNWVVSNCCSKFQKTVICSFPYVPSAFFKKSEPGNDFSGKSIGSFMLQNLHICYLSYTYKIFQKNSIIENKIENYILDVLIAKNAEVDILSKVMEEILINARNNNTNILSSVVTAYNTTSHQELKRNFSNILMKVILEDLDGTSQNYLYVMGWIKSLPNQLCKPLVFIEEVEAILKLINTGIGLEVVKVLEQNSIKIIENLPKIIVEGGSLKEGQRLIANILYRCGNETLLDAIHYLDNNSYPDELRIYMKDIFTQKLEFQSSINF